MTSLTRSWRVTFPGKNLRERLAPIFYAAALVALPAAAATTTTTLTVTSGGSAVSTVTSGSVVTLTATVLAGATPVTVGQVDFCDATAVTCADIHLLATAQLTSAGTATLKYVPGPGSHSYKAVFLGTASAASSASSVLTLSVTGKYPTFTTLTSTGNPGDFSLTADVAGGGSTAPTGSFSILDSSDNNAVLGTAPLIGNASGPGFFNLPNLPNLGINQSFVREGDFNGDGIPDLVLNYLTVVGDDSPTWAVSVMLGAGDGTFTLAPGGPYYTAFFSGPIALGDFNGDGNLDLVINGFELLGNGDGTFTAGPAENLPDTNDIPIVVGDFNGDGKADLITNSPANTFTVFLGNGDGTFTSGASLSIASSAVSIASGDLNGDGITDLAVASNDSSIIVLLGNGDGTFTAGPVSPVVSGIPTSIAEADFNGDGIPDLAVTISANYETFTPGSVMVFLGSGNGLFTAGSSIQNLMDPVSIVVEDFNGDGNADLVIAEDFFQCHDGSDSCAGSLALLLGNGDGTFLPSATGLAGVNPIQVIGSDLNGDGIPDVVIASVGGATPDSASVNVLLGTTQSATATLNGFAVSPATGTHQVIAEYPGDSNYKTSTSAAVSLGSVMATPTIRAASSPNPAAYGSTVTLSATVTGSGSTPTGSVAFSTVNGQLGTATLNASGVATYLSSGLPVGSYSITASYAGDTNYNAATSAPVSLSVGTGVATAKVISSAASAALGSLLTFAATVSGGGVTPTGSVNFLDGTTQLGTGTLVAGVASYSTSTLAIGSHSITVSYSGDGHYSAATSPAVTVNILAASTVKLTSSANSVTYGMPVTLSAAVTGGTPVATGTVTFSNGSTVLGTGTLNGSGVATYSTSSLPVGMDSVTAAYSGDANYAAATSGGLSITVNSATATVALAPASASFYAGTAQAVTLSVAGATGLPTPTGTITLSGGTFTSAATALSAGSAAITIPANSLANGSNTITAAYSGDATYGTAKGTATYVVSTTAPGFTISGTAVTVSSGASSGNSSTVSVTPVPISGFTGSVALSAAITSSPAGATDAPTLSFGSTSPVSLSGTTAGSATLTITTTASTSTGLQYPTGNSLRWAETGVSALACVLLFGVPARRRSWRATIGSLLLAIALVVGVNGCGGGSGSGSQGNPGTTAGAYQITVTGVSGSITETTVVNLTVE
jgi:Bacterial Ig-like domain (group 3)/FG-GAP-like repeat